jgi:hypothetical protein
VRSSNVSTVCARRTRSHWQAQNIASAEIAQRFPDCRPDGARFAGEVSMSDKRLRLRDLPSNWVSIHSSCRLLCNDFAPNRFRLARRRRHIPQVHSRCHRRSGGGVQPTPQVL